MMRRGRNKYGTREIWRSSQAQAQAQAQAQTQAQAQAQAQAEVQTCAIVVECEKLSCKNA